MNNRALNAFLKKMAFGESEFRGTMSKRSHFSNCRDCGFLEGWYISPGKRHEPVHEAKYLNLTDPLIKYFWRCHHWLSSTTDILQPLSHLTLYYLSTSNWGVLRGKGWGYISNSARWEGHDKVMRWWRRYNYAKSELNTAQFPIGHTG